MQRYSRKGTPNLLNDLIGAGIKSKPRNCDVRWFEGPKDNSS